jgi:hypothetical protein
VYEYMANGSLKDHLHCMILLFQLFSKYIKLLLDVLIWFSTASGRKALSWQTRLQIAMDVANALVSSVLQTKLLHLPCHFLGVGRKKVSFSDCDQVVSTITTRGTFILLTFVLPGCFIFKLKSFFLCLLSLGY